MRAFHLRDQKLCYGNFLLWEQHACTRWVWFMAKKMKSLLTQRISDLPNDTEPIVGKIDQVFPLSLDNSKAGKEGGAFPL